MSATETITFTSRGQMVLPSRLRHEYHIQKGTRAIVVPTPNGILIQPITKHTIASLHGILKAKPGSPSLREEWARHKTNERKREDTKA